MKKFFSIDNHFFSILVGLIFAGTFCAGVYVFAVAGVDAPWAPGVQTNPSCAPGSNSNCTVYSPIPYTGATGAVDLGSQNFSTLGTGTFGAFKLGTSTTSGYVLTADTSGNGSWQASTFGVPYIGATQDVNLGTHNYLSTGNLVVGGNADVVQQTVKALEGISTIGSLNIGSGIGASIGVKGNYAYLLNFDDSSFDVYDISTGTPVFVSNIATASFPESIAFYNNKMIVTNYTGQGFQVFDISNPLSIPAPVTVTVGSGIEGCDISGHFLFLTGYNTGRIYVYNVIFPTPTLVGSFATQANPFGLKYSNSYLYVVTDSGYLQIFRVNGTTGSLLPYTASSQVDGMVSVDVSGSYAYTLDSGHGSGTNMTVWNISSPSNPTVVKTINVGSNINNNSLLVSGNYVYLSGSSPLQVYSIANPSSPSFVGSAGTSSSFGTLALANGYVYAHSQNLYIFNVNSSQQQHNIAEWYNNGSILSDYIKNDGRFILDPTGTLTDDGTSVLQVNGAGIFSDGVITKDNTGAPTLVANGQIQVGTDGSAGNLYFYSAGHQYYINGTGSFYVPGKETTDPISGDQMKIGDYVVGMLDKDVGDSQQSLHGSYVKLSSVLAELEKNGGDLSTLNGSGTIGSGQVVGVTSQNLTASLLGLGIKIKNGITKIASLTVDNFTAKTARMQEIEMVATNGDIYCTWIDANGDWQKAKGDCTTVGPTVVSVVASDSSQAPSASANATADTRNDENLNILSVAPISDINVDYGTALTLVNLPTAVTATLSDSTTQPITVTWDGGTPVYDPNTAGTYVFSGALSSLENITNTNNLTASVSVIVAQNLPTPTPVPDVIQQSASSLSNGVWDFIRFIFIKPIKNLEAKK